MSFRKLLKLSFGRVEPVTAAQARKAYQPDGARSEIDAIDVALVVRESHKAIRRAMASEFEVKVPYMASPRYDDESAGEGQLARDKATTLGMLAAARLRLGGGFNVEVKRRIVVMSVASAPADEWEELEYYLLVNWAPELQTINEGEGQCTDM